MCVLLIENNVKFVAAIAADPKADAITVELAASGDDALYLLRDYQFDVVLLNQRLPDMDCATLISRIRATKHATPIIALSALPQARLSEILTDPTTP
ncbi:MAG: response regulator transcription factor [Janthinobacterium lividum]